VNVSFRVFILQTAKLTDIQDKTKGATGLGNSLVVGRGGIEPRDFRVPESQ